MNYNLAYQEDPLEELIDGRLVARAPAATNHNIISKNISLIFGNYLKKKSCMYFSDGEVVFLTPTNRFIPDGMIVCDRNKIKFNGVHGAPDLVIEILSPSTFKNDRTYKKAAYAAADVKEYWIVDPKNKLIEQYFLENKKLILHEIYMIHSEDELEMMSEIERTAIVTEFKCSLYDDLLISLDDIFDDLL